MVTADKRGPHGRAPIEQARDAGLAARTVLVVDDDVTVRAAVALVLELEGYRVRVAEDGRAALLSLQRDPVDAIVLDLEMPVMPGWEFRREQLADPRLAGIPVLVLSSSPRIVDANRRLPKPFAIEELIEAVRELAGAP